MECKWNLSAIFRNILFRWKLSYKHFGVADYRSRSNFAQKKLNSEFLISDLENTCKHALKNLTCRCSVVSLHLSTSVKTLQIVISRWKKIPRGLKIDFKEKETYVLKLLLVLREKNTLWCRICWKTVFFTFKLAYPKFWYDEAMLNLRESILESLFPKIRPINVIAIPKCSSHIYMVSR